LDILLKELDPGQQYIFQARAKAASGKTSPWSTAFEHTTLSDTIAPNPVTGLSWSVVGTSFIGTWTKPALDSNGKPLKDFKDYQVTITAGADDVIYYASQERFDFTIETNRNSFGDPEPDLDISIKVRDLSGNLSTAVTDNAVNPIPLDVTNFVADGVNYGVSLNWDATTDTDLKNYEIYMSTSGSGFTPGPSNLIYTGTSNSLFFSSTDFIVHYFKIRAVDVFNQGSANYVLASATPESSTDIDLTPPDDPTGVAVTTSVGANGLSSINVVWDAVGSSNLSDYLIRYSLDEIAWQYINVPSGQEEAVIANLQSDTDYYVQVASVSHNNVKSDFVNADVYPIETAADVSAPSQPSSPSVSVSTLSAQVSHDMTKQAGGDLEADVEYLEVHASTTNGFTPSNSTLRGTITTGGQGIDVSGVFYFPTTDSIVNLYWKVIAVDRAKNKSTPSNQVIGTPNLILNINIGNATITSAKINDLEANKITAGTGIINNLSVKSSLTIDVSGQLKSNNYNGTDTGYSLDTTGLTIYSGTISAGALQLQDSQNIMLPPFSDFEFNDEYYETSNIANPLSMSTVGTGLSLDILSTDKRFGNKCLRLFNAVITNPTVHDLIFATGGLSATGVNIDVSPGTYIFSGYFKKNGSVNALMKFGLYPETGSAIVSTSSTISSTSWTRFEAQLVIPSGVSTAKAYLEFGPAVSNTGYDFLVDGLQLERKMTGATSAGPWKAPSKTVIDGGQIVTGSIRSSANSSTVAGQPAWSINTAGNMQIGDALIRGTLIVGSNSLENSYVRSSNYSTGVAGWTINADGSAEFNNVSLRGQLIIYDATNTEVIRVGKDPLDAHPLIRIKHPTSDHYIEIFNYNDGGGTIRPTMYFSVIDSTNGPSSGYLWYDQISSNGRGRMRLHVESSVASNDVDLFLVGGDNVNDTGYVRVTKPIKATDPTTPGVAETWHNITINSGSPLSGGTPQVKLMPDGTCILRGGVTGHSIAGNTVIATLPTGFRPATAARYSCATEGTGGTVNVVGVATNGQISIIAKTGVQNNSWFDQIKFSII
jgi:fibronectin type III domain protein